MPVVRLRPLPIHAGTNPAWSQGRHDRAGGSGRRPESEDTTGDSKVRPPRLDGEATLSGATLPLHVHKLPYGPSSPTTGPARPTSKLTDQCVQLLVRTATWWSRPPLLASGIINNFTVLDPTAWSSRLGCPFLCPGSKVSSCEGTPGPSLGPPAGAYTTAVDDRRLPPVHWGSAGAEHPEGGLLGGFCLNKQAPRQKKDSTKSNLEFRV